MEPITHFLTGACIGRAGLNRRTAYATLITTLCAEFPDIDVVWSFKGPVEGFAHHRGVTHSFVGLPLEALFVLGFVYCYHRWRTRRGKAPPISPRWGLLFLFGIVALLSHLLLDFTNNYGVRPFLPFNWHWYSWDIVFIVEPVMLLALLLGLVLPSLFGLVNAEVGARKERFRGRWSAVCALLAVCAMWWMRDYQHRRALTMLNATDYRGEVVKKAGAMPYPVNPFVWGGVVETDSFFAEVPVYSQSDALDLAGHAHLQYKSPETPITLAAKSSRLGRVYLDWAKFPLVETQPQSVPNEDFEVVFRDLRFAYSPLDPNQQSIRSTALSAAVILNRNLQVEGYRVGRNTEKP